MLLCWLGDVSNPKLAHANNGAPREVKHSFSYPDGYLKKQTKNQEKKKSCLSIDSIEVLRYFNL